MKTLTAIDKQLLKYKQISLDQLESQLKSFKDGFPPLEIGKVATLNDGIMQVEHQQMNAYIDTWKTYQKLNKQIIKFVPASGAATRMFNDLYAFLNGKEAFPSQPSVIQFFQHIHLFAFYDHLNAACFQSHSMFIPELMQQNQLKKIIQTLLDSHGLNYGNLPKALLLFHHYPSETRTPLQEHLVESAQYAANAEDHVQLHFTVSPNHAQLFQNHLEGHLAYYEEMMKVHFDVSFSEQKSHTDTIAVDLNNNLFRDANGDLVFRPGGHGALIENLNDIDADIIFIKNIDNVTTDQLRKPTITYKQLLGGILVETKRQLFAFLHELDQPDTITSDRLQEMITYCKKHLNIEHPMLETTDRSKLIAFLHQTFNRPTRVCGMVVNQGEPGGGPYFVRGKDGGLSLQIVESSQIDLNNPHQKELLKKSTHFNPVDIVCAVKNYKGKKFNLKQHIDPATGFIAQKSKDGKVLKALELPGLWNGAMSDWNTIFVDVPLATFSPVKTVNDLLRPEHR